MQISAIDILGQSICLSEADATDAVVVLMLGVTDADVVGALVLW